MVVCFTAILICNNPFVINNSKAEVDESDSDNGRTFNSELVTDSLALDRSLEKMLEYLSPEKNVQERYHERTRKEEVIDKKAAKIAIEAEFLLNQNVTLNTMKKTKEEEIAKRTAQSELIVKYNAEEKLGAEKKAEKKHIVEKIAENERAKEDRDKSKEDGNNELTIVKDEEHKERRSPNPIEHNKMVFEQAAEEQNTKGVGIRKTEENVPDDKNIEAREQAEGQSKNAEGKIKALNQKTKTEAKQKRNNIAKQVQSAKVASDKERLRRSEKVSMI